MVKRGPTNPVTIALVRDLHKEKAAIWKRVAEILQKPARARVEANLSEISRNSSDGELVVVPGKVLGTGELTRKVTISCRSISKAAEDKIKKAGGKVLSLTEAAKEYPKGTGARLLF